MRASELKVNRNEMRRNILKSDFYAFVRYFWPTVVSDKYIHNFHIEYICDRMQNVVYEREVKKNRIDLGINVCPAATKTLLCQVMFPNWLWINYPEKWVGITSYSEAAVFEPAFKARSMIQSDKWTELFDIEIDKNKASVLRYGNNFGGVRLATSTGGTITSFHFDYLITDDPIKPGDVHSRTMRERAIRFRTETLSSREKVPGLSPYFIIMQRLHYDDPFAFELARKNSKLEHICLPAELTDDVKPIELRDKYRDGLFFPERITREKLDEELDLKGVTEYACQYLQTPSNKDSALFKPKNNRYFTLKEGIIECPDNNGNIQRIELKSCYRYFTIDLSITGKQESDYTVILYVAVDNKGNLFIIDCIREKMDGAGHKKLITDAYYKYKPHKMAIEGVQYQSVLVQELELLNYPVKKLKSDKDKVARAMPASARHESGKIYFNRDLRELKAIELELQQFPMGKNDDIADTLAYAVQESIETKTTITLIDNSVFKKKEDNLWNKRL